MNDPRETLYRRERSYLDEDKREVDEDEDIQNAMKEIEKHEKEIQRLKGLIDKWRKEKLQLYQERKRDEKISISSKRKLLEFNSGNDNFDPNNTSLKRVNLDVDNMNAKLVKSLLNSASSDSIQSDLQQQNFMVRKVHSFYNDELFDGNRDNHLNFKTKNVNEICKLSGFNLFLRYIPKEIISTILKDYNVLSLQKLFKIVRPPDYDLPYKTDFAVIGIVHELTPIKISQRPVFNKASNISIDDYSMSKARSRKAHSAAQSVNKHFNIKLTDLKQTIVVTVHGQELIKKYYNSLKPGDLIMFDSPMIFKFNNSSEKYGFGLSISEDNGNHQIMEVGKVLEYSRCDRIIHANTQKGSNNQVCGMFFNKKNQKCCDYHQESDMESGLTRRMELNSGYLGRRITNQERQQNHSEKSLYTKSYTGRGTGINRNTIIGVSSKSNVHFKNDKVASRFFNTSMDDHEYIKLDPKVRMQLKKEKKENTLLLKKLTEKNKGQSSIADPLVRQSESIKRADAKKNDAIMMLKAAVQNKQSGKKL
ncbi:hypothetical protein QEN19_004221 [Hanseniaspora menglaensis]